MPIRMPLAIILPLALFASGASDAQITSNPIPEPIMKKGLAVEIRDLVRLPDTRGKHGEDDVTPAGWARMRSMSQSRRPMSPTSHSRSTFWKRRACPRPGFRPGAR